MVNDVSKNTSRETELEVIPEVARPGKHVIKSKRVRKKLQNSDAALKK